MTPETLLAVDKEDAGERFEAIPDAVLFPIERIIPQRNQPRSELENEKLKSIAASIKAGAGKRVAGTGLIHPLLVRWETGAFLADGTPKPGARVEIVAGETRYHAGKMAELSHLPVIITDLNSDDAYEDALSENILRGDLSPSEEGRAFQYLKNKWKVTTDELTLRLYNDPSRKGYVSSRLEMMRLNPIVRELVDRRLDTITAARRIQTIKSEEVQREMVDFMLNGGNFAELNKRIQMLKGQVNTGQTSSQKKEEAQSRQKLKDAFPSAPAAPSSNTPAPPSSENSEASPSSDSRVYGTPRAKGIKTAPGVHVGDALDSLGAQMEGLARALAPANLPRATRKKYAPKMERLAKAFAQIQFDLDPQ